MGGLKTIHLVEPGTRPELQQRAVKTAWIFGVVVLVCLVISTIVLLVHWPFSERNVRASLGKGFGGKVTFTSYKQVYWPHPGLIALGVTLRKTDDPTVPPLATAERLVVTDRWTTVIMLQHRLRLIKLQGVKVVIPPPGTREHAADFPPGDGKDFSGPDTYLEMVKVEKATLQAGDYVLPVPSLTIEKVYRNHASDFQADVELLQPKTVIHASGRLGPLHSTRLGEMPVRADFLIREMRLSDVGSLDGTLHAQGKLSGKLSAIGVEAQTDTDGFAVSGGKGVGIQAEVSAVVNGMDGDIALRQIDLHTKATEVRASGSIAGKPKRTELEIAVDKGRLEDVMQPFLSGRPPMVGPLRLHSHATIAPGRESFLDRLSMDANFSLPAARYTTASTEQSLSAFSRRARGADPHSPEALPQPGEPLVTVAASGPVALRQGIARSSALAVLLPGADIRMSGMFNLKTSTAALTGDLTMKPDLSHVTTGIKATLLKPLSPLFRHGKKPDRVTVIPIKVTGTKDYKVGANFFAKK